MQRAAKGRAAWAPTPARSPSLKYTCTLRASRAAPQPHLPSRRATWPVVRCRPGLVRAAAAACAKARGCSGSGLGVQEPSPPTLVRRRPRPRMTTPVRPQPQRYPAHQTPCCLGECTQAGRVVRSECHCRSRSRPALPRCSSGGGRRARYPATCSSGGGVPNAAPAVLAAKMFDAALAPRPFHVAL